MWAAISRQGGVVGALMGMGLTSVAMAESKPDAPAAVPAAAPVLDSLDDLEAPTGPRKPKRRSRAAASKPLPNPGKYDEHQKECKEVLQADVFQGARMEMNYTPVQRMDKQMGFTFATHMDSFNIPGGKSVELGANVYSEKTLLLARIDQNFQVMGRFHQALNKNTSLRTLFQSAEDFNLMMELDYKGKDAFTHYKFGHGPNGGHHILSYQQSLTERGSVGGEILHQPGQGTHLSFDGRYHTVFDQGKQSDTWTAHMSTMGMAVGSYTRKITPQVSLASELNVAVNPRSKAGYDSALHLGVLYKYQTFRLQANLRSSGVMQMALEQQMAPGMALMACSEVEHWSGGAAFGFGFRVGQ